MSSRRTYQTNFAAGELTPRMAARADTNAYANGAARIRNYRQLIQGGIMRRPGTRYVDTIGAVTGGSRLIEFAFNDDQSYVMIFQPGQVAIYTRAGALATTLTGAPWTTDEQVNRLRTTQNGDTMIVTHADFPPQRIVRTGATSFSLQTWDWEVDSETGEVFQAYFKHADARVTLKADRPEGTGAVLTASAPVFVAGHVGEIVRHKGRQIKITAVNSGTEAVGDILRPLRAEDDINKDLLENNRFLASEFWQADSNWSIRNGLAIPATTKTSRLRQEVLPTEGNSHSVAVTTSNGTTGSIKLRFDSQVIASAIGPATAYTGTFTPDKGEGFLILEASADFDGNVTLVSLKEGSSELVNETDLSDDQYWIAEGAWVIANNRAYLAGGTTYDLRQKVLPQIEKTYIFEIQIRADQSAGSLTLTLGEDELTTFTTPGLHTHEFRAQTGEGTLKLQADAAWDGPLQRVSLRRKPDNDETVDWDEPAFSTIHGYPRVGYFHDQRMIFAGGRDVPNGIFMSKPGAFFNFDDGDGRDDDGIAYTIAESRIAEIRALTSLRHLQVFTSEGELYIPIGEARPLTPANVMFKKQTPLGVSAYVEPREFDGAILFVPKSEATVREFVYSDIQQAYSSDATSLLAQHLISQPRDMDVALESQGQPEQYAYIVNADGTMPVFLSNRAEEVTGWTLWTTAGKFHSVANVADRVFVLVERDIGGAGPKLYLEHFDQTLTLDCATELTSGSETASWTAAWLANETVQVTSGTYYLGAGTADGNGTVSTGYLTTSAQLGLNYTPELETLPPEVQMDDGPSVGEARRIVKASVVLDQTLNLEVTHQQKPGEFSIRQVTDDLSAEPTPITDRQDFRMLGWDDFGVVRITQNAPLKLTILGLNMEIEY